MPAKAPDEAAKPDGNNMPDLSSIPSIMFNPELIARLDEAIASVRASNSGRPVTGLGTEDDLLKQLLQQQNRPADEAAPVKTFPVFFLDSIIYTSRNEWSAWINGVKFTNRNNVLNHMFTIADIDKRHVTVRWLPTSLLWPDLMNVWKGLHPAGANRQVSVDEMNHAVTFTLHPNQTFIAKAMAVREGHYVGDTAAKNAATSNPGAPNDAPRPDK
jgi:hypothetical protein